VHRTDPPFAEAARELVRVGRFFSGRGSVPATSGNFSMRVAREGAAAEGAPSRWIAITRSGADKGDLAEDDILAADVGAPPPPGSSAETPLHLALYRDRPDCAAVVHTHADAAAVLSLVHAEEGRLVLRGWELLKALRTHEASVEIPVFGNDQDVAALAARVSASLAARPDAVAYLLAGHGLYTWGSSAAEAKRHAVALEHLLTCELQRRRLNP
jgi:methylthioribulose-1-phosphate dehydratase